jgi:hypothetical protein
MTPATVVSNVDVTDPPLPEGVIVGAVKSLASPTVAMATADPTAPLLSVMVQVNASEVRARVVDPSSLPTQLMVDAPVGVPTIESGNGWFADVNCARVPAVATFEMNAWAVSV